MSAKVSLAFAGASDMELDNFAHGIITRITGNNAYPSQHIIFDSLTAGTMYTVQVRSLGGPTGQSDWSDPSSHCPRWSGIITNIAM